MKFQYIKIKSILIISIILCILSVAFNLYIHTTQANKFNAAENDLEVGMSTIKTSLDKKYNYRIETKSKKALIVAINNDYLDKPQKRVVVPKSIDGHKVAYIDTVTSSACEELVLPDTLESIRTLLFFPNDNLKKIYCAGEELEFISENAFSNYSQEIYTKKDSKLYKYCVKKGISVKIYN